MAQETEFAADGRRARQEYPKDRFDQVAKSGRVGAHRVTPRPRYFWQFIIAALLGFALLTTAGVLAVQSISASGNLPISSPVTGGNPLAPVAPELDPEATVAILNGSQTRGLAAILDRIITEENWGKILFSGTAASSDVTISAVFYADPADAEAAAGLASKLGGLSSYPTEQYQKYKARLVVLIGSDYAGPGLDEAKAVDGGEAPPAVEPDIDPVTGWAIDPDTGWPIDPETGLPVDPAALHGVDPVTGWAIDPNTGWPINPVTGLPEDPATIVPPNPEAPATPAI